MKPIRFSTILAQSKMIHSFCRSFLAPVMVLAMTQANAGTSTTPAAAAPETTEAANWVTFAVGGAWVNGDEAGMMRRTQTTDFWGGIESLSFTQAVNDSVTLSLDGHALPGLEDYEVNMSLEKNDVGYLKAGYREFRTWYDGSGGYNPYGTAANAWKTPFDDELHLDRGQVYFEAGLRIPDRPQVTFRYEHLWRDGEKDSTIWGRTNVANVPSYWSIDESRDIFQLDVQHTIGNTDIGIGMSYDISDNEDTRHEWRQLLGTATDRKVTQTDAVDYNLFDAHAFTETRFGEKAILSFAYDFTTFDSDVDGSTRVFNNVTSIRDEGYRDMVGGSEVQTHTANVNLWWNPIKDLVVIPSFRVQWEDYSTSVHFTEYAGNTPEEAVSYDDEDRTTTSEELEVRYSGIENILVYARGQWSQEDADRSVWEELDGDRSARLTDISTDSQKYTVGANYYPCQGVSLSAQYYYQTYDQDFDHKDLGLTPMMRDHSFDVNDANIRLTWHALPNLSLVTRYDYQQTDISNRAYASGGDNIYPDWKADDIESAEIDRHIISESVTWNACENFYIQGSVHWIMSETDTGYNDFAKDQRSPDYDNDYFAGSLTAGYAIDSKTDLVGSFTYYGASNYAAAKNAMGYGLNTEEYGVSLTLTRILTQNMIWNLRYAMVTSNTDPEPDQSGGFDDFTAQMVSTGLQIRF